MNKEKALKNQGLEFREDIKRERGVNAAYIRTEHDWKNHSRQPSGTYVHGETS